MSTALLATKLYSPPPRPDLVNRAHLIERLNNGLRVAPGVSLLAAPAGFGKTTLLSKWLKQQARTQSKTAWLSLDEADNDLTRFLTYLVAALRQAAPAIGENIEAMLASPQPPPLDAVLTPMLNTLHTLPHHLILVLDDYHVIENQAIDAALTFIINHQPAPLHLVIATRQDPPLPLARLRARGQLTELRAADLRFTPTEVAEFLKRVMGLNLSTETVVALETRTEGWAAGLQLAALSMRGQENITNFIESFSGGHHFILDYLLEEVLHQQPETVQNFLRQTAILDRLCGSLCEAVTGDTTGSGGDMLAYLQQANLFITPLDNERRWFRYHHLFADLLRQRLAQQQPDEEPQLHRRAAAWYDANNLITEAFQHAAAANDIPYAERLLQGKGMPLYFQGGAEPALKWLESLSEKTLNQNPSLWVAYASALTISGRRHTRVELAVQQAEAALQGVAPSETRDDLQGQLAAIRAMLAVPQNRLETIISQSQQALALLHPDNLSMRSTITWTLGFAYQLQQDHAAAAAAYRQAIAAGRTSDNRMIVMGATTSLGQIQEAEGRLNLAAENYRAVLALVGQPPWPTTCEAYLGLGRIHYQWNDLGQAAEYAALSLQLARQLKNVDTPARAGILLARLKLAQGETTDALTQLAEAEQFVRQHNFEHWHPDIVSEQVRALLQQQNVAGAARLATEHNLPRSLARVYLAQGKPAQALAALQTWANETNSPEQRLKQLALMTLAHQAAGEKATAIETLTEALALAEPGRYLRIFVDEGPLLINLLREAAARGIAPAYVATVLAAFKAASSQPDNLPAGVAVLVEPLTAREEEVLRLLVAGRSNPEIAADLIIAVTTVKTHVKNIYGKLQVSSRLEAVTRAQDLKLL